MGKRAKRILPILAIMLLASTAGVLALTGASGWLLALPERIAGSLSALSAASSATPAASTRAEPPAAVTPNASSSGSPRATAVTSPLPPSVSQTVPAGTSPSSSPSASPAASPAASSPPASPAASQAAASPPASPAPSPAASSPPASPAPSPAASSPPASPAPSPAAPSNTPPPEPQTADTTTGPWLTLSVERMQQGDVVAVWLDNIPESLANTDIRFRASWLGKPVPAHRWGDRLVALIQATISVNPNTYSVRAVTIGTDASGTASDPVEIPGTRKLIRIEKRAFEQQIFSVSKELEQTRSDANLAADAEKVAKAKSDPSVVPLWKEVFQMPIEGGIAKAFGKQRIINGKLNYTHSGVDISATEGTPIHAPAAGRVVFSGALIVSGNTVIVDHGLGMFSSLVHMSRTDATVGQEVAAGEVVGYVGATGFATGPHLHWTLTVHGNSVDPEYLMRTDPLRAIRADAAAE